MDHSDDEPIHENETVRRVLFNGFESQEEFLEALHRLDQYLQTLKDWNEKLKWKVPPELLN